MKEHKIAEQQVNNHIAGNTATGMLKLFALAFMMTDHMGKMLFPQEMGMRVIGRLAFPIYAWCIVVGFQYTRSVCKYSLRILISGLLCQIPYLVALGHYTGPASSFTIADYIHSPNIFFTLLLGLMAIWGIRDGRSVLRFLIPAATLAVAELIGCDYGWHGVLLIVFLYLCRGTGAGLTAVMISFCLYWGSNSYTVTRVFGLAVNVQEWPRIIKTFFSPLMKIQTMAVFALPFILFRNNNSRLPQWIRRLLKWRMPLWVSYTLYPVHLAVLILLERI